MVGGSTTQVEDRLWTVNPVPGHTARLHDLPDRTRRPRRRAHRQRTLVATLHPTLPDCVAEGIDPGSADYLDGACYFVQPDASLGVRTVLYRIG